MEPQEIILEDHLLSLIGLKHQTEVLQPLQSYDGMSVKDIILYKKRFKNQAILLRKARRVLDQRIDSGSDDGDGSGEDLDDNVSNPSVSSASTRGSSSRQLAGSKRKRKQTIGEKAAKGAANQQRKSLSSKKSLKPCTALIWITADLFQNSFLPKVSSMRSTSL
ncbi:hypothetical protein BC941DRAFT_450799 [Chlamydoabsidia padenii]|nr:hypothetical protein BC941DRAFT_450799 [Chlamydoabsidia padenii]